MNNQMGPNGAINTIVKSGGSSTAKPNGMGGQSNKPMGSTTNIGRPGGASSVNK